MTISMDALFGGEAALRSDLAATKIDVTGLLPGDVKLPVGTSREALGEAISSSLAGILHIEVPDVLLGAWQQAQVLHKYADPANSPPDREILQEVGSHRITVQHHPTLQVYYDGHAIDSLAVRFDIEIGIEVQGLLVVIRDRRARRIRTGRLRGTATVKAKGVTLKDFKGGWFNLPGEMPLGKDGEGIALV